MPGSESEDLDATDPRTCYKQASVNPHALASSWFPSDRMSWVPDKIIVSSYSRFSPQTFLFCEKDFFCRRSSPENFGAGGRTPILRNSLEEVKGMLHAESRSLLFVMMDVAVDRSTQDYVSLQLPCRVENIGGHTVLVILQRISPLLWEVWFVESAKLRPRRDEQLWTIFKTRISAALAKDQVLRLGKFLQVLPDQTSLLRTLGRETFDKLIGAGGGICYLYNCASLYLLLFMLGEVSSEFFSPNECMKHIFRPLLHSSSAEISFEDWHEPLSGDERGSLFRWILGRGSGRLPQQPHKKPKRLFRILDRARSQPLYRADAILQLKNGDRELQDNVAYVKKLVRQNGLALEFASVRLRGIREVVEAATEHNGRALTFAERHIQVSFLLKDGLNLQFLGRERQNDKDMVELALERNVEALRFASEDQQRRLVKSRDFDDDLLLRVLRATPSLLDDPDLLRRVHRQLQEKKEFVEIVFPYLPRTVQIEQLKKNAVLLYRCNEAQKNDDELVDAAVGRTSSAIVFASKPQQIRLLRTRSFEKRDMAFLFRMDGSLLQYAVGAQDVRELVVEAFSSDKTCLQFASERIREDFVRRDPATAAYLSRQQQLGLLSSDGMWLRYLPDLQDDDGVVDETVMLRGEAIQFASREQQLRWFKYNEDLIQFCPAKREPIFVDEAFAVNCRTILYVPEYQQLRLLRQHSDLTDRFVWKRLLRKNGLLLRHAPAEVKNDDHMIEIALLQNLHALEFVSEEKRKRHAEKSTLPLQKIDGRDVGANSSPLQSSS